MTRRVRGAACCVSAEGRELGTVGVRGPGRALGECTSPLQCIAAVMTFFVERWRA